MEIAMFFIVWIWLVGAGMAYMTSVELGQPPEDWIEWLMILVWPLTMTFLFVGLLFIKASNGDDRPIHSPRR